MAIKGSTYIMSEQQKEAIRQARKGYVPSKRHRERISEALMGHPRSSLAKLHISRGMKLARGGNQNEAD